MSLVAGCKIITIVIVVVWPHKFHDYSTDSQIISCLCDLSMALPLFLSVLKGNSMVGGHVLCESHDYSTDLHRLNSVHAVSLKL